MPEEEPCEYHENPRCYVTSAPVHKERNAQLWKTLCQHSKSTCGQYRAIKKEDLEQKAESEIRGD